MKKTRALLLAALLIVSGVLTQAAQAEHYGALRSSLETNEMSLGLGAGVEHEEWEGPGVSALFIHRLAYAQGSLGLGKAWAVSARVGMKDMDQKAGSTGTTDFVSSPKPFIGGTFGGPLYQGKTLSIGPMLQGSYYLLPPKYKGIEIENLLTFSGAMLAQLEIEGASLYLGPTLNFGYGEVGNADIELDKKYGGVMGIRWLLPDSWPTEQSRTYLDLELSTEDFYVNRLDATVELNFTF